MENRVELKRRISPCIYLDMRVAVACERARYAGNNTSADCSQGSCWGSGLEADFIPRIKSTFVRKPRLQR